jgi:hypothetical protein
VLPDGSEDSPAFIDLDSDDDAGGGGGGGWQGNGDGAASAAVDKGGESVRAEAGMRGGGEW